ncbi:MAG: GAF domain-containing protein [Acidobacteriota bacterium]|nr:GAF domain-containing protein [Acidobacteriota bacterium]
MLTPARGAGDGRTVALAPLRGRLSGNGGLARPPRRDAVHGDWPGPRSGAGLAWRLDSFNKFLLAASPVSRVTASLAREVCHALGFSRGAFLLANVASRTARGTAGDGVDCAALCRVNEPFDSSPWILGAIASGHPRFTRDARGADMLPRGYADLFGLGPLLCVPVFDAGRPVAVILLDRRGEPFAVTDELMRAAECVGSSLGLALHAARGYDGREGNGSEANADAVPALTARQRQILGLLARGMSNKEISATTGLSVFTVRDHVSALLRTLGAPSRTGAVARAWELDLLGRAPGGPS